MTAQSISGRGDFSLGFITCHEDAQKIQYKTIMMTNGHSSFPSLVALQHHSLLDSMHAVFPRLAIAPQSSGGLLQAAHASLERLGILLVSCSLLPDVMSEPDQLVIQSGCPRR